MITSAHPGAVGSLRRIMVAYLDSVLTRNPTRSALGPQCRVTVNAVVTGPEVTPSIDDFPALQIFSDPAQGGVVVAGAARIAGALCPYGLRLRVENEHIVEVETLLS